MIKRAYHRCSESKSNSMTVLHVQFHQSTFFSFQFDQPPFTFRNFKFSFSFVISSDFSVALNISVHIQDNFEFVHMNLLVRVLTNFGSYKFWFKYHTLFDVVDCNKITKFNFNNFDTSTIIV